MEQETGKIILPGKLKTFEEKPEKRRLHISICVPIYCSITTQFFIQFMRFFMEESKQFLLTLSLHEQQPISVSREFLVNKALEKNPDYIFFLDSDNIMPSGGLKRLIETMENNKADLVTAMYFHKDRPHYPVIRTYRSDGFYKIENPDIGQIFEISGCGLGACLIRPDIFKKLDKPWFKFSHEKWGESDITLSEDLYFSRQLMQKGLKMLCDATVISAHIGSNVDVEEYMTFAPIRESTMMERDELIADIVDYTGRSQYDVDMDLLIGVKLIKDEWNTKLPQGYDEIKKFYKETKNYLYDSTLWHFGNRRNFDLELFQKLVADKEIKRNMSENKDRIFTVLDFGAGIGQNAIMLARGGFDVTLADLDGFSLRFAEFRFNKHKIPYKVWYTDREDIPPLSTYDYILCFDVIEHIPSTELKGIIDKLIKLKHKDTQLISTISLGDRQNHPMHFENDNIYQEQITRLFSEV